MFKIKENKSTKLQNQQLINQIPDSYSLTLKNSSYKSSQDQLKFSKESRRVVKKKIQSNHMNHKTQSIQLTQKKVEYVETENEMLENQRKQIHSGLENYQYKIFDQIGCPRYTSNKRIQKICKQYIFKLMRSLKPKNVCKIQKMLQGFNDRKIVAKKISRIQKLSQILSILWKIVLIVQFFILATLQNFSQQTFFVSIHFISLFLFIAKEMIDVSLQSHFDFKRCLIKQVSHKLIPLVNIISIILWFNSHYTYLFYLNKAVCLLYFQILDIITKFVLITVTRLRLWLFLQNVLVVKIMLKMILFSYIVSLIFCKLYHQIGTQTWVNQSMGDQNLDDWQLFILSLSQSLSVTFSFGLYMPLSINTWGSVIFCIIRIAVFLLNLTNLRQFFNNRDEKNKIHKISKFKHILQTAALQKEHQQQVYNLLESALQQRSNQQQQNQNVMVGLSQTTLKKIMTNKYQKQINIFTSMFPFLLSKIKIKLAQNMKLQIYSKNQIIKDFNRTYDFIMLKEGQVVQYYNFKTIYKTSIKNLQNRELIVLNNSFIAKKFPNYKLKCVNLSKICRLQQQSLRRIIRQNKADFEYFWLAHHSQWLSTGQFKFQHCKLCQIKHSEFYCPKLHYIPFKNLIISRYLIKKQCLRRYDVFTEVRIPRLQISALKFYAINLSQFNQKRNQNIQTKTISQLKFKDKQSFHILVQQITEILYQKQIQQYTQQDEVWNIKADSLCDYKYYFKVYNPSNLKKCKLESFYDFL